MTFADTERTFACVVPAWGEKGKMPEEAYFTTNLQVIENGKKHESLLGAVGTAPFWACLRLRGSSLLCAPPPLFRDTDCRSSGTCWCNHWRARPCDAGAIRRASDQVDPADTVRQVWQPPEPPFSAGGQGQGVHGGPLSAVRLRRGRLQRRSVHRLDRQTLGQHRQQVPVHWQREQPGPEAGVHDHAPQGSERDGDLPHRRDHHECQVQTLVEAQADHQRQGARRRVGAAHLRGLADACSPAHPLCSHVSRHAPALSRMPWLDSLSRKCMCRKRTAWVPGPRWR